MKYWHGARDAITYKCAFGEVEAWRDGATPSTYECAFGEGGAGSKIEPVNRE